MGSRGKTSPWCRVWRGARPGDAGDRPLGVGWQLTPVPLAARRAPSDPRSVGSCSELSPDRAHIIFFAITKLLLCVCCKVLLYRRPFLKWCLEALWVWERRTRLDFVCEPNHEDDLWPPQSGAIALPEESGHPPCERTGQESEGKSLGGGSFVRALAVVGAVLHSRR